MTLRDKIDRWIKLMVLTELARRELYKLQREETVEKNRGKRYDHYKNLYCVRRRRNGFCHGGGDHSRVGSPDFFIA